MKLFTASEMRAADIAAAEKGVALVLLMETAGRAVAEAARTHFPEARRVLVVCGKGNNGGDGYVVARHLLLAGREVTLLELASSADSLSSDESRTMRAAWLAFDRARTLPLASQTLREELERTDLLIDGLFGSGLSRALEGELAQVVDVMNASGLRVLSIDVPSGLSSDQAEPIGPFVRATRTVQLAGPKISSALHPAKEAYGIWETASIGVPSDVLEAQSQVQLLDDDTVRAWLPTREEDTHKYKVGTVLVVAGSKQYGGAAQLTSRAALRAGAGLVTLASSAEAGASWPELILERLEERGEGALEQILELPQNRRQRLVVGPGLAKGLQGLVPKLLKTGVPTVIDASGLTGGDAWFRAVRKHGRCVLTPHLGEAAGLMDMRADEIQAAPLQAAKRVAKKAQAVVVLKGRTSVIAAPDGRVAVSARGHPGMATGGSGDVLSGFLGAWLDEERLFERVAAAVYVHGLAGELAAAQYGDGLIASDLIEAFPRAWLRLGDGVKG